MPGLQQEPVISPESSSSDKVIGEKYRNLCELIEDWVNEYFGSVEHDTFIFDKDYWSDSDIRLLNELLDKGATIAVALKNPKIRTFVVMRLVMRFLWEKLLRRSRWLLSISGEHKMLPHDPINHLHDVCLNGVAEVRETTKCNSLASLVQSTYLQDKRSEYLQENMEQLLRLVKNLVDEPWNIDQKRLLIIFDETAELAIMIHLHPDMYYHVYQFAPQMTWQKRQVSSRRFTDYSVVETKRGKKLSNPMMSSVELSSIEGHIHSTVFPALKKVTAGGDVVTIARGLVIADILKQQWASSVLENVRKITRDIDIEY